LKGGQKMEISNNFLAVVLVITLVVGIAGIWMATDRINKLATVTGYAEYGYVNLSITNFTNINVTATDCNFGSGYVEAGANYAILASNGTVIDWNGTGTSNSIIVRNDGNQNVSLNVTSGKNKTEFFGGGTYIDYRAWSFHDLFTYVHGCVGNLTDYPGVEMDKTPKTMCTKLFHGGGSQGDDEVSIGCYLQVSMNTPTGPKTDTWTFTADAV